MLLYAAGELPGKYRVPHKEEWTDSTPAVKEILDLQEKQNSTGLCLKSMCRKTIRDRLLSEDRHVNLFYRVTKLGLPPLLAKYVVYDMSVEEDLSDLVAGLTLEGGEEGAPAPGVRRGRGRRNRPPRPTPARPRQRSPAPVLKTFSFNFEFTKTPKSTKAPKYKAGTINPKSFAGKVLL